MKRALRTMAAALRLQWRAAPFIASLACTLSLLFGLVAAAEGWLMKSLLDELTLGAQADSGRAAALATGAAAIAAIAAALLHATGLLDTVMRWRVTLTVERDLFGKVNGLSGLRELESPSFQGKMRLAEQAAQEAPQQLTELTLAVVRSSVTIISATALVWLIIPRMVWVLLLAAAVGVAVQIQRSRRDAALSESLVQTYRWRDHYRALLLDLNAAKEIRLYGLGQLLLGRLLGALGRASSREIALARRSAAIQAGLTLLSGLLTAGGAVMVVRGALAGRFQIGDVALFLAAVAGVQAATRGLVLELGGATRSLLLFASYLDVIDLPAPKLGTRQVPPLRRGIELRDVWFRYHPDGPWVLRGVDLHIAAGQSVGLVGVNGAGKSTLVKLLCRFWDIERGQILWDGVDLRELDANVLRARIAVTFQDFVAYDASAADNIGFGDVARLGDLPAIRAAASLSEIDGKLARLPGGYRALLSRRLENDDGADGIALSGGEWQRVALARSLFRRHADLLILDEPSSGLDPAAEYRLHRTAFRHTAGRTRLLVSHRLSTLRGADRIAVLGGGRIIEQGSHDQLMSARGIYASLFALQARGYQDARVLPGPRRAV